MWQKCPICNGTGIAMAIHSSNAVCSVCQGRKIISEVNGLPPASTHASSSTTYIGTDFRDQPMESQDEYFGRNKK